MVHGTTCTYDVWSATLVEQLHARKLGNPDDYFSVAVVGLLVMVGNALKQISPLSFLFLQWGGSITCQVAAPRNYSEDLPLGELEIPCMPMFQTGMKGVAKVENLIHASRQPVKTSQP